MAEVRFYQELAGEIPVRIPRMFRARHRPWTFRLELEDLSAAGCTLPAPDASLTLDQARRTLRLLAALHKTYWEDKRFGGTLRWLSERSAHQETLGRVLARPLTELGLHRAGSLVTPELRTWMRRYAAFRGQAAVPLSQGPQTLTHHDCHPGNLFFTRDGEPGLLDWQLVRMGSWAADVAYLLSTGLCPRTRREHFDALVEDYLIALPSGIRPGTDAGRLVRMHMVYPFEAMLLTLALGAMMPKATIRSLVRRTAVAVEDCDSFALLFPSATAECASPRLG